MDGGNSRAWIAFGENQSSGKNQPVQAGVIERGTAAQGVPVRQITRCRTRWWRCSPLGGETQRDETWS